MTTTLTTASRKDALASWENEGGAISSGVHATKLLGNQPGRPSVIARRPDGGGGGFDRDMADKHTLAVLQISLLLVVPVLAAMAMFWASPGAPR